MHFGHRPAFRLLLIAAVVTSAWLDPPSTAGAVAKEDGPAPEAPCGDFSVSPDLCRMYLDAVHGSATAQLLVATVYAEGKLVERDDRKSTE